MQQWSPTSFDAPQHSFWMLERRRSKMRLPLGPKQSPQACDLVNLNSSKSTKQTSTSKTSISTLNSTIPNEIGLSWELMEREIGRRMTSHVPKSFSKTSSRSSIATKSTRSASSQRSIVKLPSFFRNVKQASKEQQNSVATSLKEKKKRPRRVYPPTPPMQQKHWLETVHRAISEAKTVELKKAPSASEAKHEQERKQKEWLQTIKSSLTEAGGKSCLLEDEILSVGRPRSDSQDDSTAEECSYGNLTVLSPGKFKSLDDDDMSASSMDFLFNWLSCNAEGMDHDAAMRLQRFDPRGMIIRSPSGVERYVRLKEGYEMSRPAMIL